MMNFNFLRMKRKLKEMNKRRLLMLIRDKGEYLHFSPKDGYVYEVEQGVIDGTPVLARLALKSGNIQILSLGGESVNEERHSVQLG